MPQPGLHLLPQPPALLHAGNLVSSCSAASVGRDGQTAPSEDEHTGFQRFHLVARFHGP